MATKGQHQCCQKIGGLWVLHLLVQAGGNHTRHVHKLQGLDPGLRTPCWLCVLDLQIQADHCQGVHAGMARLLDIMVTQGQLWVWAPQQPLQADGWGQLSSNNWAWSV